MDLMTIMILAIFSSATLIRSAFDFGDPYTVAGLRVPEVSRYFVLSRVVLIARRAVIQ